MSHWQNVTKKVLDFSTEYQLLTQDDRLLVGVSGGADSVFLAHLLKAQGYTCHLAHVNYGLRGPESDEDQRFVEELAGELGCSLAQCRIEAPQDLNGNFQEWARDQRYEFFTQTCTEQQLDKIVVAHHLTDQVETFLLRMLRGSGTTGLAAMRPRIQLLNYELIRPLLPLKREEILGALKEKNIGYREDESNDSDRYRRNQLRHHILPQLREIQTNFESALGDNLLLMQDEDAFLDNWAGQTLEECRQPSPESTIELSRKALQSLPKSLRLRVLRRAIGELTGGRQSITFHHVSKMEQLLNRGPKKAQYDLPGGLQYEQGPLAITILHKASL